MFNGTHAVLAAHVLFRIVLSASLMTTQKVKLLVSSIAAAKKTTPLFLNILSSAPYSAWCVRDSVFTRQAVRCAAVPMHTLRPLSPTFSLKVKGIASNEGEVSQERQIPRLLYGTAWKKERTEDLVYRALKEGFTGIDTACQPKHYEEPGVGRGIVRYLTESGVDRSSLFIQTKYTPSSGHDHSRPLPYDEKASIKGQVRQSIQKSLENLQCSYLDSVLLHSPLRTMEQTIEAWQALEEGVENKLIHFIGISNCYDLSTLRALSKAAKIQPQMLQNRFYPDTGYDKEIRNYCERKGIVYQAFWTLTANPHMLRSPLLQQIAAKTRCTSEQVWFRYMLQKGFIVLTGTTSIKHMQDDLNSLSINICQEDLDAIDNAIVSYQ